MRDYGLHGIPLEDMAQVGDFMARVRNCVPDAEVAHRVAPLVGEEYVVVKVAAGTMDEYTLLVEEGDELKTFGDSVWIRKADGEAAV